MNPKKEQAESSTERFLSLIAEMENLFKNYVPQDEFAEILASFETKLEKIQTEISENVAENKDDADDSIAGIQIQLNAIATSIQAIKDDEQIKSIPQVRAAINTLAKQITDNVNTLRSEIPEVPEIPEIPDHRDELDDLDERLSRTELLIVGENIRNALEALPEEDKLVIEAVKGLREELDEIRKIKTTTTSGHSVAGRDLFQTYDLSPYLDGVTKTFDIPGTWNIISVDTSSFPHALRKNIDYTWTPQSITFTSEIEASTTLAQGQTVILTLVVA